MAGQEEVEVCIVYTLLPLPVSGLQSAQQSADTTSTGHTHTNIMDRDSLRLQIDNMKFQARMERWPLSRSVQA